MSEQIQAALHTVERGRPYDDEEISLLDLAITLAKHKKAIALAPLIAGALTAIYTLFLPNIYTADTTIMPPQQQSGTAAMLASQLGALAGGGGGGLKSPNDLYVAMLKSRNVQDGMIQRFRLREVYKTITPAQTRSALQGSTKITVGKDGLIEISVDDQNPKRAAAMANGYVDELQRLTGLLAVTEASQRRLFFAKQLYEVRKNLADAELTLKQTQEKTGLIQLDAQAGALVQAAANLKAQVAMKEVQLNAMRTFATGGNPDYIRVQQELAGLRAQLSKVEVGSVTTAKAPEAGLDYLRKARDVKYYETVYELLAKQYEAAKLDEARESSVIQVLDRAVVPEQKAKPARSKMVLIAALAAGFLAVLWAFVTEALQKAKEDKESGPQLAQLRNYLRWRTGDVLQ
jgi:uncharacterized protein involved in exopolysaccharide biosynthesis